MEEKIKAKKIRRFLLEDDGFLEGQLMLCSLFLIAWEMLREALRGHLEGFFAEGHEFKDDDIKHIIPKEHKKLFEGTKALNNQLEIWKNFGTISDQEIEFIQSIRGTRNKVAHKLAYFIVDDDFPVIEMEWIIGVRNIIHKIDNWWLRNVEVDINPMLLDVDLDKVDFDKAYSLRVGLLTNMIDTVEKKLT